MPSKLSAGIARQIRLPHDSSLGANYGLQIALDHALVGDLDALCAQVRTLHATCAGVLEGTPA